MKLIALLTTFFVRYLCLSAKEHHSGNIYGQFLTVTTISSYQLPTKRNVVPCNLPITGKNAPEKVSKVTEQPEAENLSESLVPSNQTVNEKSANETFLKIITEKIAQAHSASFRHSNLTVDGKNASENSTKNTEQPTAQNYSASFRHSNLTVDGKNASENISKITEQPTAQNYSATYRHSNLTIDGKNASENSTKITEQPTAQNYSESLVPSNLTVNAKETSLKITTEAITHDHSASFRHANLTVDGKNASEHFSKITEQPTAQNYSASFHHSNLPIAGKNASEIFSKTSEQPTPQNFSGTTKFVNSISTVKENFSEITVPPRAANHSDGTKFVHSNLTEIGKNINENFSEVTVQPTAVNYSNESIAFDPQNKGISPAHDYVPSSVSVFKHFHKQKRQGPTLADPSDYSFLDACQPPKVENKHSQLICASYPYHRICTQICFFGYTTRQGIQREISCHFRENRWLPYEELDFCRPFVDCTITLSAGGYARYHQNGLMAPYYEIACSHYEDKAAVPLKKYKCNIDGKWTPELPFCATAGSGLALFSPPKGPKVAASL